MITGLLAAISAGALFTFLNRVLTPPDEADSSIAGLVGEQRPKGASSAFAHLNPKGSLMDRLDYFLVKKLNLEPRLAADHILLGSPQDYTPVHMLKERKIIAVLGLALGLMIFQNAMGLLLCPLGFMIGGVTVSSKIRRRQEDLLANFPTVVDLGALIIESGLDYMTAFERIVKIADKKTPLETELEKMLSEVQLGYSRRDALRRFASRTGVSEIRSFVGLIIQSDELGTSLVDLLRNFSTDMRFRRLNRAERLAAQAATKMLVPLFVFIFPTVFILMLAPMVKNLITGGGFF